MQLQMQQQLDDMALEINDLRGQLEKNSYDMQQMLERQRELFIGLDKLRGQVRLSAPVAEAAKESAAPKGKFSTNLDEGKLYQNAVDLILKSVTTRCYFSVSTISKRLSGYLFS